MSAAESGSVYGSFVSSSVPEFLRCICIYLVICYIEKLKEERIVEFLYDVTLNLNERWYN